MGNAEARAEGGEMMGVFHPRDHVRLIAEERPTTR
jgi:hypothetical protein